MVSASIAGVLRSHGGFVEAIYQAYGNRQFTQSRLTVAGISVPENCTLQKLRYRGVVERISVDGHQRKTWRLSPQVVNYYTARATQEASA